MYDVIILSGASGAGKTFLIEKALQQHEWLCQIPSVTTREKREHVDESRSRVFLSASDFIAEEYKGDLVFVNSVFESKYAYRYSEILKANINKKTILLDMKVNAVAKVKSRFPKTFCIYIKIDYDKITKAIGNERNNLELRITDANKEQDFVDKLDSYKKIIDIIFDNHVDEDSIDRFLSLMESLR